MAFPTAAIDIAAFMEQALAKEVFVKQMLGNFDMANSRNRVDKVLGFRAPNWADEVFHRRKIDRQESSLEEIERALRAETSSAQSKLVVDMRMLVDLANALGFTVIADDMRAAARQIEKSPIHFREYFRNSRDPRP